MKDDQDEVLAFLGRPETHGGAEVTRCDTHAAVVFLAGSRALKVKRQVQFPFLDYSTLARREAACRAEMDINRRYAPQLYRSVVAITRGPSGSLALDGPGEVVEWAVDMRRFDESQTLDHLADRGLLNDTLAHKLATMVGDMHDGAGHVDPLPWIAAMDSYVKQNTEAFGGFAGLFGPADVAALDPQTHAMLHRLEPLLRTRGAQGHIRKIHGDLHLGNIALIDGQPVAFDAIEFDPVVGSGDVLYDLAFLLMDLVDRNLGTAANIVLNDYLARRHDLGGLAALPFFMSLRAAIRAKVTAAKLAHASDAQAPEIRNAARRYFDHALDFLQPRESRMVAVGGLSGTGKSVLARALAGSLPPAPGAIVLRSDVERKRLFGVAETERLPAGTYDAASAQRVYRELLLRAETVVQAGFPVIVDATFDRPEAREAIESLARKVGIPFQGLFLVAPLDCRLKRVAGRSGDASDADTQVVLAQVNVDPSALSWSRIDADGPPNATLERARQALATDRSDFSGAPSQGG